MLDERYVEAVTTARDFMAGLRKGATRDLEDVLLKKTQKCVEEICLRKSVSETDASNIHVLMKALDLFPASKGVGDLKNKFLKWQRAMACELNKKEVAALADKIEMLTWTFSRRSWTASLPRSPWMTWPRRVCKGLRSSSWPRCTRPVPLKHGELRVTLLHNKIKKLLRRYF